jgi:hypothetical protein
MGVRLAAVLPGRRFPFKCHEQMQSCHSKMLPLPLLQP